MSEYLTPAQGAKELITRIDGSLKSLAAEMRKNAGRIRVDAIWGIPLRETALVDATKPIVPVEYLGIDAVTQAIECLTTIWLTMGQNMRETLRAPGIVGMPGSLVEQVRESNHLRMELYNLIQPLEKQERVNIWRAHSNISGLQTQRLTKIIHEPKAIRFYWDKSISMRRVGAHALAAEYSAQLKDLHGIDPDADSLPDDSLDRKMARARDMLLMLGVREPVAIYRHGQPHVRARIHAGDQSPSITPTSVPFVYDIEQFEKPVIAALRSYEPGNKATAKRSSRAKVEADPFFESLYIHRYLEAHRQPLTVESEPKKHLRHQRNNVEI